MEAGSSSDTPLSDSRDLGITERDLLRTFDVTRAWADSTCEAYSSGILVYHVHCDKREVPEALRAPVSQSLIASFIASLAGFYPRSTISNYLHGSVAHLTQATMEPQFH